MNSRDLYENLDNKNENLNVRCPNMLIEKDGKYALFNSDLAVVPGVNPIEFNSLDEYSEFLDWQKSQNINCPILYLQYSTDTQNNDLIQIKPSVFENDGGVPFKGNMTFGKENLATFKNKEILLLEDKITLSKQISAYIGKKDWER